MVVSVGVIRKVDDRHAGPDFEIVPRTTDEVGCRDGVRYPEDPRTDPGAQSEVTAVPKFVIQRPKACASKTFGESCMREICRNSLPVLPGVCRPGGKRDGDGNQKYG